MKILVGWRQKKGEGRVGVRETNSVWDSRVHRVGASDPQSPRPAPSHPRPLQLKLRSLCNVRVSVVASSLVLSPEVAGGVE